MPAVQVAAGPVGAQIVRVGNHVEIVTGNVDAVSPGISRLKRQTVDILGPEVYLQRVIVGVCGRVGDANVAETQKGANAVSVQGPGHHVGTTRVRQKRRIELTPDRLIVILVADVSHRQHGSRHELMLDAQAPLLADGKLVFAIEPGHARGENGHRGLLTVRDADAGIGEIDVAHRRVKRERRVRTQIVDVISLDPLVEQTEAASQHGFGLPCQVVSKPDPGPERVVVVVDETTRNAVFSGQPHTIQIERNIGQWNTRNGAEPRTGRVQTPVGVETWRLIRLVQVGIEIGHAVGELVGMGNGFPAQPQVQRQPVADPPTVGGVTR